MPAVKAMQVQRIATRQITTHGEAGHLHHSTQYPHPAQKSLTPAFIPPPVTAVSSLTEEGVSAPKRDHNICGSSAGKHRVASESPVESADFADPRRTSWR
jgi:hypothetical protein